MGIKSTYLRFMMGAIPDDNVSRSVVELGNQRLKWDDVQLAPTLTELFRLPAAKLSGMRTGKQLFEEIGWKHMSIDINGCDGAVAWDLDTSIPQAWGGWDVVTDFGTAEHVPDQYMLFNNVHQLCRVGGLMVHIVSANRNHGAWNYDTDFFHMLARACKYEIVRVPGFRDDVRLDHMSTILRKTVDVEFPNRLNFLMPEKVGDFNKYYACNLRRERSC